MKVDDVVEDDPLSSLFGEVVAGHVLEEHEDEVGLQDVMVEPYGSTYVDDPEDGVVEDVASLEWSAKLIEEPLDEEQVLQVVHKEEEQAREREKMITKVWGSLLMDMLMEAAVQWVIRQLEESLEEVSSLYGWEKITSMPIEKDSEHDATLYEAD
ncbi:hypothetical protein GOP47_0024991 [Adiantum capillus-veneris]|uniref:Uncharacterized protein n=1 Tax=Adiantum capillus-veneris TaxID=13818 RepID=A0A9D4U5F1_ADICA|nr:hypothetical protein GOP47_0024991 [Adiantum capillus-veneris]